MNRLLERTIETIDSFLDWLEYNVLGLVVWFLIFLAGIGIGYAWCFHHVSLKFDREVVEIKQMLEENQEMICNKYENKKVTLKKLNSGKYKGKSRGQVKARHPKQD